MKWAVVVKGWAYRVLAGQGVGLQDPRGSTGRFDGYFDEALADLKILMDIPIRGASASVQCRVEDPFKIRCSLPWSILLQLHLLLLT